MAAKFSVRVCGCVCADLRKVLVLAQEKRVFSSLEEEEQEENLTPLEVLEKETVSVRRGEQLLGHF